jgi:hypothetical protein
MEIVILQFNVTLIEREMRGDHFFCDLRVIEGMAGTGKISEAKWFLLS